MEFENKKTRQRHFITDIFIDQLVHIYKTVDFYIFKQIKVYLQIF